MNMPTFDPRQPERFAPDLWRLVLVAAVSLFLGLILMQWQWRGAGEFSASEQPHTLQQAREYLQHGDDAIAVQLFSNLAKKNNPNAQYWLGHMMELGLGTKRDLQKAIGLYKQAADKNVVAAELRLGELYLHGNLVWPDSGKAKAYLERAAYQGEPRAAMLIGEMYQAGTGTPPDLVKAYAWWEVATIEGNTFAKRERDAALHALDVKGQKAAVARAKDIVADIKRETTLKSSVAAAPKPNTASSPTG
jgi:TPR repeat protein